ncbi:MAG: LysM peptidoglycan-binding domain-containing protein [Puniceicoccales bacterium]|nr:LysM peptidoglycan-binding domain-containing protein [Puniceicoccales bacterium]
MKPAIVISAVVFVHAAALLILGCQSNTGFEDPKVDTNISRPQSTEGGAHVTPVAPDPVLPPPVVTPVSERETPPPPPPPEPEVKPAKPVAASGKTYVVKSGDSLHRVAKREGVSVKALARANGLPENAQLKLKQKLIIPGKPYVGSEPPAKDASVPADAGNGADGAGASVDAGGYRTHKVQDGEVLGGIAKKYKVSVAKLMELNGITDARKVRAGKTLRIPHSKVSTPQAGGAADAGSTSQAPVLPPVSDGTPTPPEAVVQPPLGDSVVAEPPPPPASDISSPSSANVAPAP